MVDVQRTTLARGSTAKAIEDRTIEDVGLAVGTRVGDYQITGEIGRGGMGVVYSAKHPDIGKQVAIKVVHRRLSDHPIVRGRVLQEARILTEIRHPNVVDVYSFGQLPDGRSYLVMELVQGTSLAHRIDYGSLSLSEILVILEQTASALAACHEQGVVHRDLKPENILLRGEGDRIEVTLFDFGIAKAGGLHMRSGLTGEGTLVGTPEYMSPEQARAREVDARCDAYALGVVAYEMLTGRLPFRGATVVDTLSSILHDAPVPLGRLWQDCPPGLEELVGDLLAKDADDRPSIQEVRVRLASIRGTVAPALPLRATTIDVGPTPAETGRADTRLSLVISPLNRWLRRALPVALVAGGLFLTYVAFQTGSRADAARAAAPASPDEPVTQTAAASPEQSPASVEVESAAKPVAEAAAKPKQATTSSSAAAKAQTKAKRAHKAKAKAKRAREARAKRRLAQRRSENRRKRDRKRVSPDGLLPFPGGDR